MEPIDDLAASEGWHERDPAGRARDGELRRPHLRGAAQHPSRQHPLLQQAACSRSAGVTKPPSTLDELFAAPPRCSNMASPRSRSESKDPWTLPLLLFENLLVARAAGPTTTTSSWGSTAPSTPRSRPPWTISGELLSFTNAKPWTLTWSQAVDLVGSGQAAMTIMGDWAKAQLLATQPNLEFRRGCPRRERWEPSCSRPTRSGSRKGRPIAPVPASCCKLFGSREGQDTFNPLKGSIPARKGANMDSYDPRSRATIDGLRERDQPGAGHGDPGPPGVHGRDEHGPRELRRRGRPEPGRQRERRDPHARQLVTTSCVRAP